MKGWKCPSCNVNYSPSVTQCECSRTAPVSIPSVWESPLQCAGCNGMCSACRRRMAEWEPKVTYSTSPTDAARAVVTWATETVTKSDES